MTPGVKQAAATSTAGTTKTDKNAASAHDDGADFKAALGLTKTGKSGGHYHRNASSAAEQEADHLPRQTGFGPKSGARGGGEKAKSDPTAIEAPAKPPATPISAMMLARELEASAQRDDQGPAEGEHLRNGTRNAPAAQQTPDVKIDADPASLIATDPAVRNVAGQTQPAMPQSRTGVLSGSLTAGVKQSEAATTPQSDARAARLPSSATLTLSLTSIANPGQPAQMPGDPTLLSVGREFLQTLAANANGDGSPSEGIARRPEARNERVTVVAQQNIPAPVAQPSVSTTTALANVLSAEPSWRAAATPAFQPLAAQPGLSSAHTMKIQLHPAELGMVTANLRLSGEHITVELRVENGEAYRRLSADSADIVKSLRAMGLDIDHVTIQQPQSSSSAQGRTDGNNASAGSAPGDQQASNSAHSGGNGDGRQQPSGNSNTGSFGSDDAAPASANPAGDGLYI
ncbi:flagellar hook-length control protein FliK [Mesorhizobium sp. KR1-2]|uniref:flagellar hook-length control protein FliK n=1 Tax=Mesorhizobium sp. KR1-2 TaxID=3156609 RepID=UPI0032B4B39F